MILSTPSLGITLSEAIRTAVREVVTTFNSLSRDHFRAPEGNVDFDGPRLSTPSLGITYMDARDKKDLRDYLSTPSLGITIPGYGRCDICGVLAVFQLPLSGSRFVEPTWLLKVLTFNSLSRDHRALFRDFPALRGFPPRRPFAHLYLPATI